MDQQNLDNLDEIILEEKKLVAREHFLEAWEAGLQDGIDVEIIAKELISGALRQLTKTTGAEQTTHLISSLAEQDALGEFLPNKVMQ